MLKNWLNNWSNQLIFISIALIVVSLLIWLAGASPLAVATSLFYGAFGNVNRFARVVATLAPL